LLYVSAMKLLFLSLLVSVQSFALEIPLKPDADLTPGEVCNEASAVEHRYEEQIPYCKRNVSTAMKNKIFDEYDKRYHFHDQGLVRGQDFKMDHYIPLCMGGANSIQNLWPQHLSISVQTDRIEEGLCELMGEGEMKQVEAIRVIKFVKTNLDHAPGTLCAINKRLGRNTEDRELETTSSRH
jgi:hypothetical protein